MRANPVINPHATRFTSRPRAAVRSAFTLIELLLVLVILALLAAVVVPKMTGRAEDAKIKTTRTQIDSFKTALGTFEVDNGRYPPPRTRASAPSSPARRTWTTGRVT